jgi:hypothetical protein
MASRRAEAETPRFPQAKRSAKLSEPKIGAPHWTTFRNWLIREAA